MNETHGQQDRRSPRGPARTGPRVRRWHWQTILAALVALIAVHGQPVAARGTDLAVRDAATDGRPDFRVAFATLDAAQAGRPFSYTIQVRNAGAAADIASVSAVVPPELSNVRVNAPGFVCTRRFTPSGAQAGTLVACMRNDLESGATADVTIEANTPSAAGAYHLTAVADPRDEVAETDEGNNAADATILVHGQPGRP